MDDACSSRGRITRAVPTSASKKALACGIANVGRRRSPVHGGHDDDQHRGCHRSNLREVVASFTGTQCSKLTQRTVKSLFA